MAGRLCILTVELLHISKDEVVFRKGNGKTIERFAKTRVLEVDLSNTQYIEWNREKDELNVEFSKAVMCEYAYPSKIFCADKKAFEPSAPDYEIKRGA